MPADSDRTGREAAPYDVWADFYDRLYESSFGGAYGVMTEMHLDLLRTDPPGRVLDVGAGTGRLAVPLAQAGHRVTAVEPSPRMLGVLVRKAAEAGVAGRIRALQRGIQAITEDDVAGGDHDAAVCVFSAAHHLVEDTDLARGLAQVWRCLRPGGSLLLGLHTPALLDAFREARWQTAELPEAGGPVRWCLGARPRVGRPQVLETHCEVILPHGRTLVDRHVMRAWTELEVEVIARATGFGPLEPLGPVGTEEVFRLRRPAGRDGG